MPSEIKAGIHGEGLLENIIKDNGIEFDNHESDLYVFSTPQTIELFGLDTYKTFIDEISGRPMFDIPFGFSRDMREGALKITRESINGRNTYIHYSPKALLEDYNGVQKIEGILDGEKLFITKTQDNMIIEYAGQETKIPSDKILRNTEKRVQLGKILETLIERKPTKAFAM